jgi:hypothetical protein
LRDALGDQAVMIRNTADDRPVRHGRSTSSPSGFAVNAEPASRRGARRRPASHYPV